MILVIGGRSKIGSALIDELVAKGEAVRALARPHESAGPQRDGIETVTGDLADVDSLRSAFAGADRVFLLCGPTADEVQLNRHAIDIARQAGVTLLVRSSILGADPRSGATFIRDHGSCDDYLAASGVPHAIVRPNLFMQNIPQNTIPAIDGDGNFFANAGDARISMADTRDVAAVDAALLTRAGQEGTVYEVTGPEALSYHDVATKVSKAMGRTVTYIDAPDDAVRKALIEAGLGEWLVNGLVGLYQDYRSSGSDGYAAQVTDTVERLTSRPPRSLDQLLAEPAGAAGA
jgi:uncharacterized protein YbjT (DUF2867 family)